MVSLPNCVRSVREQLNSSRCGLRNRINTPALEMDVLHLFVYEYIQELLLNRIMKETHLHTEDSRINN